MSDLFDLNKKAEKLKDKKIKYDNSKRTLKLDESESDGSIIERKVRDKPVTYQAIKSKPKRTLNLAEETLDDSTLLTIDDSKSKNKDTKKDKKDTKKDTKKDKSKKSPKPPKPTLEEIKKKYPPKNYTKKEIRDKIDGYIRVPKDKWADIPKGTHIRIFKKDKKFLSGGFLLQKYSDTKGPHFLLENNKYKRNIPSYRFFPLHLKDVAYIFAKPPQKKTSTKTNTTNVDPDVVSRLAKGVKSAYEKIEGQEQTIEQQQNVIIEQHKKARELENKVAKLEQGITTMTKYIKQK